MFAVESNSVRQAMAEAGQRPGVESDRIGFANASRWQSSSLPARRCRRSSFHRGGGIETRGLKRRAKENPDRIGPRHVLRKELQGRGLAPQLHVGPEEPLLDWRLQQGGAKRSLAGQETSTKWAFFSRQLMQTPPLSKARPPSPKRPCFNCIEAAGRCPIQRVAIHGGLDRLFVAGQANGTRAEGIGRQPRDRGIHDPVFGFVRVERLAHAADAAPGQRIRGRNVVPPVPLRNHDPGRTRIQDAIEHRRVTMPGKWTLQYAPNLSWARWILNATTRSSVLANISVSPPVRRT